MLENENSQLIHGICLHDLHIQFHTTLVATIALLPRSLSFLCENDYGDVRSRDRNRLVRLDVVPIADKRISFLLPFLFYPAED